MAGCAHYGTTDTGREDTGELIVTCDRCGETWNEGIE